MRVVALLIGGVRPRLVLRLEALLAVVMLSCTAATAYAEAQTIGPLDLVIRINATDVPFKAKASADVTSRSGQFNIDGDVTVLASTATLQTKIETIAKKQLPYKLPIDACDVRITKLSAVTITARDYEARLSATARVAIDCTVNQEHDVTIAVALQPTLKGKQALGWKVMRTPEIEMPTHWRIVIGILAGNPQKLLKAGIEKALETGGIIRIPVREGVLAAFKGANFDGNATEISLRIKGDLHAGGPVVTQLMTQTIKKPALEVTLASPNH